MEEFRTMAARLWEEGERDPDRLVQDFISEALGSGDPVGALSPVLLDIAKSEFTRLRRISSSPRNQSKKNAAPSLPALPGGKGMIVKGANGTIAVADTTGEMDTAQYGKVTATLTAALTLTPLQIRQSLLRDTVWVHGRGNVPWREITIGDVENTIRFYRQAKGQAIATYDARIAFMAEAQQIMRKYNVPRLGQALDIQQKEKVQASTRKTIKGAAVDPQVELKELEV